MTCNISSRFSERDATRGIDIYPDGEEAHHEGQFPLKILQHAPCNHYPDRLPCSELFPKTLLNGIQRIEVNVRARGTREKLYLITQLTLRRRSFHETPLPRAVPYGTTILYGIMRLGLLQLTKIQCKP